MGATEGEGGKRDAREPDTTGVTVRDHALIRYCTQAGRHQQSALISIVSQPWYLYANDDSVIDSEFNRRRRSSGMTLRIIMHHVRYYCV